MNSVCIQKAYHNDYEHSKWKYTPVADSADTQHHLLNKKTASVVPLFANPSSVSFVWFAQWEGLSPVFLFLLIVVDFNLILDNPVSCD